LSDAQERQERVVDRNRGSLLAWLVDDVVFGIVVVVLAAAFQFELANWRCSFFLVASI